MKYGQSLKCHIQIATHVQDPEAIFLNAISIYDQKIIEILC